jgi:hypothetical protein
MVLNLRQSAVETDQPGLGHRRIVDEAAPRCVNGSGEYGPITRAAAQTSLDLVNISTTRIRRNRAANFSTTLTWRSVNATGCRRVRS